MTAKPKAAPPRPYASLRHRIMANVRREPPPSWSGVRSKCWIWTRGLNARGYPQMSVRRPCYDENGKKIGTKTGKILVHRLVLLEFFGIPLETVEAASHKCSTKPCCNPEHTDPATNEENRVFYYTVERPRMLAAGGR